MFKKGKGKIMDYSQKYLRRNIQPHPNESATPILRGWVD